MARTKEQEREKQKVRRKSYPFVRDLARASGYTVKDDESIYDMVLRFIEDKEREKEQNDC